MAPLLVWTGFFLAFAVLLIVSRKNFAAAMFSGAFILAIFTIPFNEIAGPFISAFTDLPTVLLALAVGLIPVIGGSLKETGQLDNLVKNMRIGKKAFLAVSPALVGMLPMPGGALLSAPLVEKAGKGVSNEKKVGLNIWFRHILYLIYPLSPSLIVSVQEVDLEVYQVIPYLAPFLLLSLGLGYFFFLRDTPGKMEYREKFSLKKLLLPLAAIFVAPILDFAFKDLVSPREVATVVGVSASLLLILASGRVNVRRLGKITKDSAPWNFALMIIGIQAFRNVFENSGFGESIIELGIPIAILCVLVGALLGFVTGRIMTPAVIIFPVLASPISPAVFAVTYFSIFLGYVLSPVHPCVSLSTQFFHVQIKDFLKAILPPTLIGFLVSFVLLSIIT
jgi:integral membrane protein (TIGR00529 family)